MTSLLLSIPSVLGPLDFCPKTHFHTFPQGLSPTPKTCILTSMLMFSWSVTPAFLPTLCSRPISLVAYWMFLVRNPTGTSRLYRLLHKPALPPKLVDCPVSRPAKLGRWDLLWALLWDWEPVVITQERPCGPPRDLHPYPRGGSEMQSW